MDSDALTTVSVAAMNAKGKETGRHAEEVSEMAQQSHPPNHLHQPVHQPTNLLHSQQKHAHCFRMESHVPATASVAATCAWESPTRRNV